MIRSTWSFLAVGLLFVALGGVSSARRIWLPKGFIIEGVSHVAENMFVGSNTLTGDIIIFDSSSNVVATIAKPPADTPVRSRSAFGVHYDRRSRLLYVAGGGPGFLDFQNGLGDTGYIPPFTYTPAVHVFHFPTGRQMMSCPFPGAGFLNDVTMSDDRKYVYVTDSTKAQLFRYKVSELPSCDGFDIIPLPENVFGGDNFWATGIQPYEDGLLINNFGLGGIFFVDLMTKTDGIPKTTRVVSGNQLQFPDGMQRIGKRWLYSVAIFDNIVFRYKLSFNHRSRTVNARLHRRITSPDLSEISGVGAWNGTLVVTNMNVTAFQQYNGRLWIATVDL